MTLLLPGTIGRLLFNPGQTNVLYAAVPVLAGDSPETLAARVLAAEHRLYAHALALFAAGDVAPRLHRDGDAQVTVNQEKALFSPPLEDTTKG